MNFLEWLTITILWALMPNEEIDEGKQWALMPNVGSDDRCDVSIFYNFKFPMAVVP